MDLEATVRRNLERRLAHLAVLGYSASALSTRSGHDRSWLAQALEVRRRPSGWTLRFADHLAIAVGEHGSSLASQDYDPTAAPPPWPL